MTDSYIMANKNRCTVHPQHVMVDQGHSFPHCAHIYECDCGEWALGKSDKSQLAKARRKA